MWRQGIELYDEYTRSNIKTRLDPFFYYRLKPFLVPLISANSLLKPSFCPYFLKETFEPVRWKFFLILLSDQKQIKKNLIYGT